MRVSDFLTSISVALLLASGSAHARAVLCEELLKNSSAKLLGAEAEGQNPDEVRVLSEQEFEFRVSELSELGLYFEIHEFAREISRDLKLGSELEKKTAMTFEIIVPVNTGAEMKWVHLNAIDPGSVLHAETFTKFQDVLGEMGEGFLYFQRGVVQYWKEAGEPHLTLRISERVENGSDVRELSNHQELRYPLSSL